MGDRNVTSARSRPPSLGVPSIPNETVQRCSPDAVRTIVFYYEDLPSFEAALRQSEQALGLPDGESARAGEWVLAMFEIGKKRRATAAAGRGLDRGEGPGALGFERRDWERLVAFAGAPAGSAAALPSEPAMPRAGELPSEGSLAGAPASDLASAAEAAREGDRDDANAAGERRPSDPTPSPTANRPSGRFATRASGVRVLLVDDDGATTDVVAAMLESVGLTVDVVDSGEAALEKLGVQPCDLVVLDWNLPGLSGIDVCRHLRRDARFAALPVLFLTARSSSKEVVEAFASGADDYVTKPFRAAELGARLFGLLRRARLAQATS